MCAGEDPLVLVSTVPFWLFERFGIYLLLDGDGLDQVL
jgi:hypothetical protein